MTVHRVLPTDEGRSSSHSSARSPRPSSLPAPRGRSESRFSREAFRLLGHAGVLGMSYPEEYGGLGQPYEVYLQALEEIAAAQLSVGLGVSVHTMTCYAVATYGTEAQRGRFLVEMVGGGLLGGYALSEAQAGST